MPAFDEPFDATQDYQTVIPEGDYLATIRAADFLVSKAGNKMLKVTCMLLEGDHKNQTVDALLNIYHPNMQTRSIAQQQLANLCKACDIATLTATEEFVNKVIRVYVNVRKTESGTFNGVKKFLHRDAERTVAASSEEW